MAIIRIDIRDSTGSSSTTEVQNATPEQVESARELILDMTRKISPSNAPGV